MASTIPAPGTFQKLTVDEMDVLRDHLMSGWTKQNKVTQDHETFDEVGDVLDDVAADRRARWNAEHPEHTY